MQNVILSIHFHCIKYIIKNSKFFYSLKSFHYIFSQVFAFSINAITLFNTQKFTQIDEMENE